MFIHNKKENVDIGLHYVRNSKDLLIDELNFFKEEITI